MIRKIAGAFLGWLFMLAGISTVLFFTDEILMMGLLIVWALIPFVTWAGNLILKHRIEAGVFVEQSLSKGEQTTGKLWIKNESFWPAAKIYCKVQVKNRLTGEKSRMDEILFAMPGEKNEKQFQFFSKYCGYLDFCIEEVYLMDWIGFLPLKVKQSARAHAAVLPDTFVSTVDLKISASQKEDAQNWSPVKKGNDQSELFALRDYVPGDSMKQIHWKLSAKRNQMIVKEASLPIEKSLLIFWDKNIGNPMPEEMDAMAESIASIGQEILSQGITFVLGWTEGGNDVFETIDQEEQLLQAIPRMIKYGADPLAAAEGIEHEEEYGKILLFASEVSENLRFHCEDVTMLICGREYAGMDEKIVTYGADSYLKDLEYIEV